MEMLLLALVAAGFACLLMYGLSDKPRAIAALRLRAEQQFRITKISDPVQSIEFDGSKATILETRQTQYLATLLPSNYVLTVLSKMPDGAKYIFKSAANGRPWVTPEVRGNGRAVRGKAPF
jgi:hypothetical protein